MNGTCEKCLCAMLLNTTPIVAFNCFRTNTTCELFSTALAFESGSFSLMDDSSSSFYFVPNLIYVMISATEQPTIITAVPSSNTSGYYGTDTVTINCSNILTNITVQIFVLITNRATFNNMYGNYWGQTITTSYITNNTHIIYTWNIASGQIITCSGGPYYFTAAFNSNGTARVTSGDTYIVTETTNSSVTNTVSGHF